MTNIEVRYEIHVALLMRSEVEHHRSNAKEIALAALKKDRSKLVENSPKTEPYKSRHAQTVAEFDELIARLGA